MSTNPIRCIWAGGAVIALAFLASPAVSAAERDRAAAVDATPVVVAQASPATSARIAGAPADAFPSYQQGVRRAAAQGPESLRRYLWRTRMIYNFYYNDFAPKE